MLSQALIKTLLESSLPLRLALLDAEPTGDGRLVWPNGYISKPLERAELDTAALRDQIANGYAWLPCNPLAIVRHAIAINRTRLVEADSPDKVPNQRRVSEFAREALRLDTTNEESFFNAVALLREVVG